MSEKAKENDQQTITALLAASNHEPTYVQLKIDHVKFLTILFGSTDEVKDNMIQDVTSVGLGAVLSKRITAFKLEDAISKDGMLFWVALDIDSPGGLMLYLITLLDFYTENNKAATLNDLGMQIYPDGFYTVDSCRYIVNNFVKDNKAKNGYIY